MKVQELAEALAAFPHECRGTSRDRNADDCPVCLAAEYLGSPGGARDEDDAPELTADDFKRPSAKWSAPEPSGKQHDDGDWLWGQLMDWCRHVGSPPGMYDSLFKIVGRLRERQRSAT